MYIYFDSKVLYMYKVRTPRVKNFTLENINSETFLRSICFLDYLQKSFYFGVEEENQSHVRKSFNFLNHFQSEREI